METTTISKAQQARNEKAEALARLRKWLKPGDTVYTILRHVSASGMSREIGLVVMRDGVDLHPNWAAATVLGYKLNERGDGIKVTGCGMDMGFHLVYSLSRILFPDGFAPVDTRNRNPLAVIGIRPSDGERVNVNIGRGKDAGPMTRAEIAAKVAKGWKFPGGRNGNQSGWDNDGGYALNQRWL